MVVRMPAWLSECQHGCYNADMVVIILDLVVIMLARVSLCQYSLHCHQDYLHVHPCPHYSCVFINFNINLTMRWGGDPGPKLSTKNRVKQMLNNVTELYL